MEQETATLILNTFDISQGFLNGDFYNQTIDNQCGTIANNRCNLTWKNINMRQVLGEMYDKYETFNMYLYQIVQSSAFINAGTPQVPTVTGSAPAIAQYGLVDVRMKGLQFLNNTYNLVSRNNTNTAYLTSYLLNNNGSAGAGSVTPMFNPTIVTFGKSTECVDINIDMRCTRDQAYPTMVGTPTFGTFIFMFKFYGIPTKEPNNIINGSRM